MKTFKLHLIRHGMTAGNLQGLYIGSGTDIPLCDEGRAQLKELKERFEYPQVDTVFSLAPERTIYMNTFSKTLAPSMRTGYMVLPEGLLPEYEKKLGFYSCTVPVFDQIVLAEFIRGGDLERYINRRRRRLRQQMQKAGG